MALTWVTSLGGPLILVPESACHHWHGASNACPEDDYGRACAVNDYIGLIDVGPTRALVLHDDPAATTFLPQYGVLVRTVAINPDVDVVAAVAEALPSVAWEAPLLWLVGEPLILFDAVYHNAEVKPDQRLRINLVPGGYVVQAAYVELAGAHLILVRFARQPDGGCLGRHPASVLVDVDLDAASVGGPGGLLERLGALRDPRSRHGRRHALGGLLAIAAAAVLAGARSYTAIAEFAGEVPQATLARLGIFRRPYSNWYVTPSERTLRRVLQQVDAGELDRVVGGWLAEQQSASATGERGAVAVDGKTVRGAVGPDGRQVLRFPLRTPRLTAAMAVSSSAASKPPRCRPRCGFRAPGRCWCSSGTPPTSPVGPCAPRSPTASPAWTLPAPTPPGWPRWPAATGRSRIDCTGCGM
jgi:Immunity protein 21/DDE_Tnp_1-associated